MDRSDLGEQLVAAGYTDQDTGGHHRYTAEDPSSVDRRYPPSFRDVTVLEDRRLVVTGSRPEPIIEVVDGGQTSLAGNAAARDLFAAVDLPEYAAVAIGSDTDVIR